MSHNTPRKLISSKQARAVTGDMSRTEQWRRIRKGEYPSPVQLGPRKIAFYEDEIQEFVASRPRVEWAPNGEAVADK